MKKKLTADLGLSIAASLGPMVVLQFFILPLVAANTDAEQYGKLITLVALVSLSAGTLGNVLSNFRLIHFKMYEELELEGDFSVFLLASVVLNLVFMALGLWFFGGGLHVAGVVALLIVSSLMLFQNYARVEFRIKLNFKYIFLESLCLLAGYLIGFSLFLLVGLWELIYLVGFLGSFIFVFNKTKILREPIKRTSHFTQARTQLIALAASGILLSLGAYVDKLLLYPLLGGLSVSVYFTATVIGKTVALVVQPVTSVMLNYLAQSKEMSNKKFYQLVAASSLLGVLAYLVTVLVSNPLLTMLYPQYAEEAMKYIHVTTLGIIIVIVTNVINTVLLKFSDARWQFMINTLYMIIYTVGSVVLLWFYGLMGFCIGILIAALVKLVVTLVVYFMHSKISAEVRE